MVIAIGAAASVAEELQCSAHHGDRDDDIYADIPRTAVAAAAVEEAGSVAVEL